MRAKRSTWTDDYEWPDQVCKTRGPRKTSTLATGLARRVRFVDELDSAIVPEVIEDLERRTGVRQKPVRKASGGMRNNGGKLTVRRRHVMSTALVQRAFQEFPEQT